MREVKESADSVLEGIENVLETHRDLLIVKFFKRFSNATAIAVIGIITLMILSFVLIFTGLGLSWWIGEQLNNMKAGYFITGGIYACILLVILLLAKGVLLPAIRDLIIEKIYEENKDL